MMLYIQTSKISSIPQVSYYNNTKLIVTIQYLLMPQTVTFLSSCWHTHLRTTSQIHVSFVYSTHSCPIYLLHSPTSPKSIFPYSISLNRVIVTLTLTLTLTIIGREISSLSGNWVVVSLTLTLTNKPRETDK